MKGTQGFGKASIRAAILITAAFSLATTGCSGSGEGDYDSVWVGDIEKDVNVSGSVGDGPIVNATVTLFKKNGEELASFKSDGSASYDVALSVSERHFPLVIDATGGTDLVTGTAPDFVLRGAVLSARDQVTSNVNPFSTFAYEIAKDLNGGITHENLLAAEDIVASSMNSGLTTLVSTGPMQTPIDGTNISEIVKASEVLAEIVRRTRDALNSAEQGVNANDVIESIGADLIDGVIEGNGGRRANERIAAVATIASAEVLLEAMRNELRVSGVDATEAMRAAVLEVVPEGVEPGIDELGITGQMIEQARISLIAAYEITNDPAVYNLLQSLDGLHDGMGHAEAKTVIPDDHRSSLKGLKHMTAGGDRALVAAINAAVRRGNPASPPENRAPVISGKPNTSIRAGERYSFSPVVSDLDGDPLTFSISGRPAWADFDRTTGHLYGTPTDADAGSYDGIIITVSDGELSNDVGPFTITVRLDNVGPTISGTPRKSVGSGERYNFNPVASDLDGDPLTFSITGRPAWANFDETTGRLYGTPTDADAGSYDGIIITVSDGELSDDLGPFTITVQADASGTPPGVVPANRNATLGARQLLQRITDNTSAPRRKVGSGLHLGSWKTFHTDPAGAMEDYDALEAATGKNPWLIGVDYDANPASPATYPGGYSAVNAVLIDHYTAGGAVSISIHAYNPCTGGRFDDLDCDIEKLITPGTTEYNNWRVQLDEYAIGLEALRVAGVPVLWRPFHEMNRSPFWWTYQNTTMTTGRFHTLWQQTFDYLSDEKGLNNLLWVFAPSIKERSGVSGTENWYPGDDYVDVIGFSNYLGGTTTSDDRARQLAFTQAIPNKPFALTEGLKNGSEQSYDNADFLAELTDNYTYVAYFMFWKDSKAPTESPNASVLFNDPLIDNR